MTQYLNQISYFWYQTYEDQICTSAREIIYKYKLIINKYKRQFSEQNLNFILEEFLAVCGREEITVLSQNRVL